MPRRKAEQVIERDESETPKTPGETLPPLEDFIRKMSGRFQDEVVIETAPEEEEDE